MDVDELGDQLPLQVSVSPQTGDGDVVDPLISHWERETAGQRVQGSNSLPLYSQLTPDLILTE